MLPVGLSTPALGTVMSDGGEELGKAAAGLIQIVFSLLFPLIVVSLCAVSYLLAVVLGVRQFGLWADLAVLAARYSAVHLWAAVALTVFVLSALPLAWVAFKEHSTRASTFIGGWVMAAIVTGGTIWAAIAWPSNGYNWQSLVFAFLLFWAWSAILEASMNTLKLVELARAARPLPPPSKQQPHGSRDDAETI